MKKVNSNSVLAVIMAILCSKGLAFGFVGGDGSADNPWQISTVTHLEAVNNDLSAHYILINDISLGGSYTDAVIAPYLTLSSPKFNGSFDGNGYVMRSLTVGGGGSYYGLFGQCDTGSEIKNLYMENISINGWLYVGCLVGYNKGIITNCHIIGDITGPSNVYTDVDQVGGIVGRNDGNITSCTSSGTITCPLRSMFNNNEHVGGIVGYNYYGTVTNCHSTMNITASAFGGDNVGGLVGQNNHGTITSCFASGNVTGDAYVGGLIGQNVSGNISLCYSTGKVTGIAETYGGVNYAEYIGGLIGINTGNINNSYSTSNVLGDRYIGGLVGKNHFGGHITNCYSTGRASGDSEIASLVGYNQDSYITSCFWDKNTSYSNIGCNTNVPSQVVDVFGKTTAEMQTQSTFTDYGWDFLGETTNGTVDMWEMIDYPKLDWENNLKGNGTSDSPYLIKDYEDFLEFCENEKYWKTGVYTRLESDLDLDLNLPGRITYTRSPIAPDKDDTTTGCQGTFFTGIFNGNGHVISNLTYSASSQDDVGLIGFVGSGGKILNLGVENTNITGHNYVGGLVGVNIGTITACYATGTVSGSSYVGGLAGYNGGTLTACYATGTVSGSYSGGLVGQNSGGTITSCYATGSVSGDDTVGGLAGYNRGILTACYADGSVSGDRYVGGLVGDNRHTLTACYATGSVSGSSNVGGLVGMNWNNLTACYATGSVSGEDRVGGLAGSNDGTVTASFWDIETSGQTGNAGGKGLTTAQMKTMSIYQNAGWADKGWVMNEGVDYPRLSWENTGGVPIPITVIPFAGNGTAEDPYRISTAEEFALLNWYSGVLNKHIMLTANLDLSGITLYPIGDLGPSGMFDGNGHTISNAVIYQPDSSYVGLFGHVGSGGQIRNLGVENMNITGRNYVGGLAGYYRGTLTACYATGSVSGDSDVGGLVGGNYGTITACYATGSVSGRYDVGGLVGWNDSGTLTACYATGSVSGSGDSYSVGGVVGGNRGTITACYATGSVSGDSDVGGLVGGNYGTITACYATGSVSGRYDVGGLVGWNDSGTLTACYATGSVSGSGDSYSVGGVVGGNRGTITACYATGSSSGSSSVGGLVGLNLDTVTASFWDIETSGQTGSAGGKGLTTAQMKTMSIFQNAGWADKSWVMNEGVDYPRLSWENTGGVPIPITVIPFAGNGTAEDPYRISTAEEFSLLSWYSDVLNKHIMLTANLDLNGIILYPIGDLGPFTGVFEGNGHTISNAVIYQPDSSYVGLFGHVGSGGQIRNLGVENMNITGLYYVGGLVGKNNGTITACYATGTVSGSIRIGGLVGYNDGTLTSCYATGSVSGSNYVGGLVGINGGTIAACYATGSGSGASDVGGLVGINGGTITACYATGSSSGSSSVGGLVGNLWEGTVTASFWDIETSGLSTSDGGIGKTTEEMQNINTFLDAGWDFVGETTNGIDDIWIMKGYPVLSWQTTIEISGTTAISLAKHEQGQITFKIYNLSEEEFNWTVTGYESCAWITSVLPFSGNSTNSTDVTNVTLDIDAMGLAVGDYSCLLTVLADNGYSKDVSITLSVYDRVDLEKFALLASYWGMSGCESGQPCAAADWFVDGTIDILDLIQLAKSWLGEEIETDTLCIQDDFETGNFTSLNWQQSGNLPWTIVSDTVYEGSYAARSGAITHSQISSMSFTADTTGLTTISFAYKVSSESGYDYLRFYIDSVQQNRWSGTVDWSVAEFPVSAGTHTFEWRYTKDNSASTGSDCAWVDDIVIEKRQPEGPISDHVFMIEMSLSYDFGEGYVSSVPVDYEFDAWMRVDDTVVSGTIRTPGGVVYPAEMETDDNENWLGIGEGSDTLEDLADFTDGEYVFTVVYANGTSQSTSILFALEDGSPIPPVDQVLVAEYPVHHSTDVPLTIHVKLIPLDNPDWTYGLEWFPVDEESDALSGSMEGLPHDTVFAGPLNLSPNTLYEIELTANHAIWSTNEDGIPYVVDKDSEVEIQFTTVSEP